MDTCKNYAVVRYTWPGKDERFSCVQHATAIKTVAEAIGLHLQFIPIGYDPVNPIQCQCSDNLPKEK